ncbi:hypothetical protein MTR_4g094802 [Medicago truncatula]|uniref:Uncharacterized protein n=1 Tax=Medicago truncatula TaxID=3880 RepID=A0A072UP52_MEDTR|nr:hypothetical protein MTR_4g094802 [Medicago truncatula]
MPAHLTSLKVDASRLHFTYSSVEVVHRAIAGNAAKLDDSLDATGYTIENHDLYHRKHGEPKRISMSILHGTWRLKYFLFTQEILTILYMIHKLPEPRSTYV